MIRKKNYHLSQDFFGFFFFLTSLVQIKIEFVKRKENPPKDFSNFKEMNDFSTVQICYISFFPIKERYLSSFVKFCLNKVVIIN